MGKLIELIGLFDFLRLGALRLEFVGCYGMLEFWERGRCGSAVIRSLKSYCNDVR